MSLGIVVRGPEGLVLAAESRITLTAQAPGKPPIHVNYDNAKKLLSFNTPHNYIGIVTYGLGAIGLRSAASYIPEFEANLPDDRITIKEFAEKLSEFFISQWENEMPNNYKGPPMVFVVAGFNEKEPYGRVYSIDIPSKPEPFEREGFGMSWGGQRDIVDRLINGYDVKLPDILKQTLGLNQEEINNVKNSLVPLHMQIPYNALPLQDCVDLAIFFIRTTISAQKLTIGIRGCGGPIDVAIITRREGFKFIQKKDITGEKSLFTGFD